MKKRLTSISIYIMSFIYFACAKNHTSYYVTTIASDIQDSHSSTLQAFDGYMKYKNISIDAKLIELSRTSGLSHVFSTVSSVFPYNSSEKNGEEIINLSQLNSKWKSIFKEIYWKRKLTSSNIAKCSQISEESIVTYSSCGKYKTLYADALAVLMYRTFVHPVMIVVDQDSCSQQFASMLNNFTSATTGKFQEPLFHFVNDSSNLLSDLSKMLYIATVQSVTTIILICSDSLTDLIFRLARSSSISYSNVLWVSVEYSSTINNTLAPPLLLSISMKVGTDVASAALNSNAIKILATKAVASLAIKDKKTSSLDGLRLVKQSISLSPESSCLIRDANVQVVLVLLRHSQYTWMPLYTVDNDMTVSQLVEDKKVSWLSRLKNHKAKIIVTTVPEEPFVATVKPYYNAYTKECSQGITCRVPKQSSNGTIWEVSCCVGSIMDLLKKLQEDLWLAIELHVTEDRLFGSIANGTWNGMIGELVTGKADIAFATLTSTTKRSAVVEFGESFLQVTLGILVASNYADEMKFFNFNFVANVTGDLLLALLGIFIVGLIILYAAENFESHQKSEKRTYTWREGFFYLSGITFQRDLGGKNPNQAATRVMFIVFAFGMVIIMTTYTATLTAVQVKQDNTDVLKGFKDPKLTNPSDSYKFATLKSSSMQEYFRFSDNDVYQKMNAFMDAYNTDSSKSGAQKLLTGELQAFIAEYPVLQYHVSQQKDCLLRAIKTSNGQSSWNVAFRKNSPWKNMISKKILEYKEKGLLDDIITRWIKSKCVTQNAVNPTSQKYRIAHFSGLIILLACTVIFSVIVLLFESWASKKITNSSDYSFESK